MTEAALRVILDCDGVLLDWVDGFRRHLRTDHGLRVPDEDPASFSMECWLGLPRAQIHPLIRGFNETAGSGFEDLQPLPGAKEAVAALYGSGAQLRVLTSAADDPAAIQRREENLLRVFGDVFTQIECLPLGASKQARLAALPSGAFVDDLPVNARHAKITGHDAFVVRASHNAQDEAGHPDLAWVDGLEEIAARCLPTLQMVEVCSADSGPN